MCIGTHLQKKPTSTYIMCDKKKVKEKNKFKKYEQLDK